MSEQPDKLISEWTRLGAGFSAAPAEGTPDLERMILDTARNGARMARLFIMGATWLNRYGELVARHRLGRLMRDELELEHRPTLGLLLDVAQRGTHPLRFGTMLRELGPATPARALFEAERLEGLRARAERRADAISRKWGLWCEPIEFKEDAIRPAAWVMRENPGLILRADFRGDLRASVLAALVHDAGSGASEMGLARRAGGSRAQVRNALDSLEMTGRVQRVRGATKGRAGGTRVELLWAA